MPAFALTHALEKKWGWLMAFGALMLVLGFTAITFVGFTSLLSVVYLGIFFIIAGLAEIVYGIRTRAHGDVWYHALFGVLFVVIGYFVYANPLANMFFLTLLIATALLISGVVTLVASMVEHFPGWGWFALNGTVAVVAAFMILRNPWQASFWVIGVLVGLEFIFRGIAWMSLGWAGRQLQRSHTPKADGQAPLHPLQV